jgi:single-strand DNA-binding protein
MNKIVILGNAVRDAELRTTNSGMPVLGFTIAVNKRKGKNDQHPETDFFKCSEFGERATLHRDWVKKGTKCCVTGRVGLETYTAKDGTNKANLTLMVDELETIRTAEAPAADPIQAELDIKKQEPQFVEVTDDDLLLF